MNSRVILFLLGKILYFLGAVFTVPMLVGFLYRDRGAYIFSACFVFALAAGLFFRRMGKQVSAHYEISNREGILTVVLTWVIAAILASIPFMASGMLDPAGAFFEAMSGLTTTGATALPEIEGWPVSLLFWRVWLHWIGGLGIIVIFIALLPGISGSAAHLFNAESSGFEGEKIVPRLQKTALLLFKIYSLITAVTAALLLFCGLDLYDAAVHAMSAVATGGFSHYNDSVAHFRSAGVEMVLGIAMFVSGGNFALYFNVRQRGLRVLLRNDEFRWYLVLFLSLTGLVTASLVSHGHGMESGFRDAFFQVASFISTTGYVSADYDQWPSFAKICLVLLYFTGACAGSTAGGIKISRFVVLLRGIGVSVSKVLHPQEARPILYNGRKVENNVLGLVLTFFALYIAIIILFSTAIAFTGEDIITAVTAVAACLSSVGPGFGTVVGATGNFSSLTPAAKIMLAFVMMLGRLEMYTVLILFSRNFWQGQSRW